MIPYRLPAGARLSARTAPRAFLPLQLQLRLQHPLLLAVCATLVLLLLDPVTAASAAAERFYPARFYPAAPDTGSAVAIPLAPGESTGLLLLTPSPSGGTVLARVLDESAEPIPGVLVEARTGRFASYGLTDAEGNVRVEGVPAGQVVLRSRPDDPRSLTGAWAIRYAPGTADSAQALRLPLADGGTADFGNVTLPAAGRTKTRVVHGDGAAWADIPVVLRSVDDQDFRRVARTGEEGKVTFAGLEPGSYRLWADMRGTPAITEAWDGTRDTLASAPIEVARGSPVS
ncbi:MAG: carboxypeptidase-like regulatory domain-containing protein, partial [Candidatus Eisenbacteria bacterium]|nr:carboxypeptidase-like regulatory domain-containing protein [Candidatus Eisenbacteria bacterium]